jgi:hypothetical protein
MQATNKMPSPGVLQEVCFRVFDVHLASCWTAFRFCRNQLNGEQGEKY